MCFSGLSFEKSSMINWKFGFIVFLILIFKSVIVGGTYLCIYGMLPLQS